MDLTAEKLLQPAQPAYSNPPAPRAARPDARGAVGPRRARGAPPGRGARRAVLINNVLLLGRSPMCKTFCFRG